MKTLWADADSLYRLNVDSLPSRPKIFGVSKERERELLAAFDRRMASRQVSRFWLESGQDFDRPVLDHARGGRILCK